MAGKHRSGCSKPGTTTLGPKNTDPKTGEQYKAVYCRECGALLRHQKV